VTLLISQGQRLTILIGKGEAWGLRAGREHARQRSDRWARCAAGIPLPEETRRPRRCHGLTTS
jgi:hypothetical protein